MRSERGQIMDFSIMFRIVTYNAYWRALLVTETAFSRGRAEKDWRKMFEPRTFAGKIELAKGGRLGRRPYAPAHGGISSSM